MVFANSQSVMNVSEIFTNGCSGHLDRRDFTSLVVLWVLYYQFSLFNTQVVTRDKIGFFTDQMHSPFERIFEGLHTIK